MRVLAGSRRCRPVPRRFGRRLPRSFGPARTPFPTGLLGIMVLVAFGADPTADPATWTWTDVSAYVLYDSKIVVKRGRTDEQSRVPPSQCRFRLRNTNGIFSPRNAVGPWYGQFGLNTPVRVDVNPGTGWHTRFTGFWSAPAPRRDVTGNFRWVPVVASGHLHRLDQGSSPIRAAARRYYDEVSPQPTSYWALDGGQASTVGQLSSGTGGAFTADNWAQLRRVEPGVTELAPWLGTGLQIEANGSRARAASGLPASPSSVTMDAAFVLDSVDGESAGGYIGITNSADSGPSTGDSWYLNLAFLSGDVPRINVYGTEDSVTSVSEVNAAPITGAGPHHLRLDLAQNGADVDWAVYLDAASIDSGTAASMSLAEYSKIELLYATTSGSLVFGHVAVFADVTPPSVDDASTAIQGHDGEEALVRFDRLCDENGLSVDVPTATASGAMGPQPADTLPVLLRQCADVTESPIIERYDSRMGLDPITLRYNQSAALTLDWSANELADTPVLVDDLLHTRNDVTVIRASDGYSVRSVDEDGPRGVAAIGRCDEESTPRLNASTDNQISNHSSWRLHRGTIDELRWPAATINLARNPDLIQQWLATKLGSRYTIANTDLTDTGVVDSDQILEGYIETIDQLIWTVGLNGVPYNTYRVGTWESNDADPEDPNTSRWDFLDSETSGSFDAGTDTSMTLITNAGPVMTTDADDLPVVIESQGVALEVSAVAGASSPQTLTVTAATVNGVNKIIPSGSPVTLHRTNYWGLD